MRSEWPIVTKPLVRWDCVPAAAGSVPQTLPRISFLCRRATAFRCFAPDAICDLEMAWLP